MSERGGRLDEQLRNRAGAQLGEPEGVVLEPEGLAKGDEQVVVRPLSEDDVPADQKEFIALNAELAKGWKPLIERKPAPPDADDWKDVKEKKHLIEK